MHYHWERGIISDLPKAEEREDKFLNRMMNFWRDLVFPGIRLPYRNLQKANFYYCREILMHVLYQYGYCLRDVEQQVPLLGEEN